MSEVHVRPKPVLRSGFCKGCGRCIEACARGCLSPGSQIDPGTGLVPVAFDDARCNGCNLCVDACPEPYGLVEAELAARLAEATRRPRVARPAPADVPDGEVPLPRAEPLVLKGNYAAAAGALLAGCRHFYGYPITPSTEGAEMMAALLPRLGGHFVQAASEVAAVNMMYGTASAGLPVITFTSSPGFSLMLEGVSYMVGSELPAVFVDIMRGGPGLGNIAPEQSDLKLACRGLGHGNTHAIVLAPSTPQEMLDDTFLAFRLAFRWRNPVIVVADGFLGQMTGRVSLPRAAVRPGLPAWAVHGDAAHRGNLVSSIHLSEADLEAHNLALVEKWAGIAAEEQRSDAWWCDDADVLLVAVNTPARMAKGAVRQLRAEGLRAGLFRPRTVWPFPIDALLPLLPRTRRIVVVEASPGQLEDELRLALSHAGVGSPPIEHVRRMGGVLPGQREIVQAVKSGARTARAPRELEVRS
jgi:pyruvate/2-oxoacid:ferredoxin oxidoreductase alpha subunit/NAD-dependent dihydropyrimidine dehydrogenase PreA subunit